jgi:hypothetical protein
MRDLIPDMAGASAGAIIVLAGKSFAAARKIELAIRKRRTAKT